MTIYLSLLVALVGGVFYLIAKPGEKIAELGRLCFFAGLLAFLLQFSPHMVGALR